MNIKRRLLQLLTVALFSAPSMSPLYARDLTSAEAEFDFDPMIMTDQNAMGSMDAMDALNNQSAMDKSVGFDLTSEEQPIINEQAPEGQSLEAVVEPIVAQEAPKKQGFFSRLSSKAKIFTSHLKTIKDKTCSAAESVKLSVGGYCVQPRVKKVLAFGAVALGTVAAVYLISKVMNWSVGQAQEVVQDLRNNHPNVDLGLNVVLDPAVAQQQAVGRLQGNTALNGNQVYMGLVRNHANNQGMRAPLVGTAAALELPPVSRLAQAHPNVAQVGATYALDPVAGNHMAREMARDHIVASPAITPNQAVIDLTRRSAQDPNMVAPLVAAAGATSVFQANPRTAQVAVAGIQNPGMAANMVGGMLIQNTIAQPAVRDFLNPTGMNPSQLDVIHDIAQRNPGGALQRTVNLGVDRVAQVPAIKFALADKIRLALGTGMAVWGANYLGLNVLRAAACLTGFAFSLVIAGIDLFPYAIAPMTFALVMRQIALNQ